MNAVVERSENSRVTLKVEVEPEVVAKATDRAFQRLVQRVNIPGFRRGKAPRRIVERTLGPDALYREALDFVMPSAYEDAVRQSNIAPYAQPEFEVVQLEPGQPLIFRATVPVEPTVELGDYHAIAVEPDKIEIGDAEVDKALANLREANSQWVPVDDREVRVGDQVSMDLLTSVNGRTLNGGKPQDSVADLDANSPLPRWANALAGLHVGDHKEVLDTVAEDARTELAGATVTYEVTIKGIKEKQLPEIDDELARSVGDYDDLAALTADLRKRLELEARAQAKRKFEDAVLTRLVDLSTITYPEVMVEEKLDLLVRETDLEFRRQGFDFATFLRVRGQPYEEIRKEWRPQAERRVKSELVLRRLAEQEALGVDDDAVEAEITRMVDGTTPDRRERMRQTAGAAAVRQSIRESLNARKALNLLDELAGGSEYLVPELQDDLPASPLQDALDDDVPESEEAIVE